MSDSSRCIQECVLELHRTEKRLRRHENALRQESAYVVTLASLLSSGHSTPEGPSLLPGYLEKVEGLASLDSELVIYETNAYRSPKMVGQQLIDAISTDTLSKMLTPPTSPTSPPPPPPPPPPQSLKELIIDLFRTPRGKKTLMTGTTDSVRVDWEPVDSAHLASTGNAKLKYVRSVALVPLRTNAHLYEAAIYYVAGRGCYELSIHELYTRVPTRSVESTLLYGCRWTSPSELIQVFHEGPHTSQTGALTALHTVNTLEQFIRCIIRISPRDLQKALASYITLSACPPSVSAYKSLLSIYRDTLADRRPDGRYMLQGPRNAHIRAIINVADCLYHLEG